MKKILFILSVLYFLFALFGFVVDCIKSKKIPDMSWYDMFLIALVGILCSEVML